MAADPIEIHENNPPTPAPEGRPSSLPEVIRQNSMATTLVATVAAGAALYFAKLVFIVLFVSLLLAFVLEPLTRLFERLRIPRGVAALISVLLFCAALVFLGQMSYTKALDFAQDLPRYSGEIRQTVGKVRKQAQTIQNTTEQVLPEAAPDKNTIKVKQQSSWSDTLFSSVGTATEFFFS